MHTETTVLFAKETFLDLDIIEKRHAEIKEELTHNEHILNECNSWSEWLSDEFRKNVHIDIEVEGVMQNVLLDEAIVILTKKVDGLRKDLTYSKRQQELLKGLIAELTKVFPEVVNEL